MLNKTDIIKKVRDAGIIGAGGAGFPTEVKINAEVDTVIINGAECEPLLYKDKELMRLFPEEVVSGLNIVMQITNAKTGIIALKAKNKEAIPKLQKISKKYKGIKVDVIEDVYPAGDEVVLVYETTKRIVPPGGIPLNVGTIVSNVETFYNIHNAVFNNKPVTESFITITGEVEKPVSLIVPVGITIKELLKYCGKLSTKNPVFIDGGPMMGSIVTDLNYPVTKACAGFIVLDKEHYLIKRKTQPESNIRKIGKSACDQCSYCTEFCPRYLLGHNVRPHMVMRSLGLSGTNKNIINRWSAFCVECKLCTFFSCPESLSPGDICGLAKKELFNQNIKVTQDTSDLKVHPLREMRKLPTKTLVQKLGLTKYDVSAHLENIKVKPKEVYIKLQQHIGAPAIPIVKVGNKVSQGQLIGKIQDKKLGANIHSSINGTIKEITKKYIKIG